MRPVASFILLLPTLMQAADPLITELQHPERVWSRDDLAAKLFGACRGDKGTVSRREIASWARLLDVDRPLKTDGSLGAGMQVREVALTCIEELTGESFYPVKGSEASMREILSTTKNGEVERFHIAAIAPKDLPAIQKAIHAWLNKKPRKQPTA